MFGGRFLLPLGALASIATFLAGASEAQAQEDGPLFEVYEVGILQLQDAMERGTVTSAQLVDAYVARIRTFDQSGPGLNAITYLNPRARLEAQALDEERARQGPRGPLHGIPVLLKDNFDVWGVPTTAGSVALSGMMPPDDSWVAQQLREAGAVLLGKANMSELAFGLTTVSSVHGQTRNPYDLTRNPGGSSGGTGVAVSASFATLGYGTDTCGSVRIPAAFNALFGLRPTKGLISMDGVVPLAHSLDTPGPMARSVVDLAIGLDAVAGRNPADPSTPALDRDTPRFLDALQKGALKGVRIGVLEDYFTSEWRMSQALGNLMNTLGPGDTAGYQDVMVSMGDGADESRALNAVVRAALDRMKSLGAEVVEVEIEDLDNLLGGGDIVDQEFKSDLQAYLLRTPDAPVDSLGDILIRGLYHPSVEESLIRRSQPTSLNSPGYREDLARMEELREKLLQVFEREKLDAIAYPTMRRIPAKVGTPQRGSTCRVASSSGFPAITMPAGLGPLGAPVGLELLGTPLDDARLLAFAFDYEQATSSRIPPWSTPPLRATVEGQVPQPR
jgi:amidase